MKVYLGLEPRTVAIVLATHALTFAKAKGKGVAVVQLEPLSSFSLQSFRLLIPRDIYGCLGLIELEGDVYLAVVTGSLSNVAHPVRHESVDRIYAVEFISLGSSEWDFVNLDANGMPVLTQDGEEPVRVVHPCFELKKLLSNGLFYYSNDFDLTSRLQDRGVREGSTAHYQEMYMWNLFMMQELVAWRSNLDPQAAGVINDNRFFTTVIRGFAKTVRCGQDSITIISKQLWRRAGTRFNARGIDDDGNVANFVETEFVYNCVLKSLVYAFTQVRGSVPAFWEQDTALINPKITLTRSVEAAQNPFDRHMTEVCQRYGVCHIVNLLSKSKPQEVEVSNRYKALLARSHHRDDVAYTHFDFHAETKQLAGGFASATRILPALHDLLEHFGWFNYDTEHQETLTKQDGVFRVNCLDCLDRTNLIEQVICQTVLEHIVKSQGGRFEELSARHNALWADNGDAISQIYTGTNALKLSFSRNGKMNFAGALLDVTKSVSRMYQNTFVDQKKQNTMDVLLGKDVRSRPVRIYDPLYDFVHEKLKQSETLFTQYSGISIFVGTFNVSAYAGNADLRKWLFPNQEEPDILAVGLQELIELSAGLMLTADASRPERWVRVLEKQLNLVAPYVLLRKELMSSMCLYLFVKQLRVSHVTMVSGLLKKTGMGGIAANKGACAVRFNYGSTTFALVTSHLAAGATAVVERTSDYQTIMQGLTFTHGYRLADHDHVLWFGDLNFRIDTSNERCRQMVAERDFALLRRADQLAQQMRDRGAFAGFQEQELNFTPTYKFDKGTSTYDSLEKQRVPSWTDRVLYRSFKGALEPRLYGSVMDIMCSDHKPVYATFGTQVQFVDQEKRLDLTREYYAAFKKERGSLIDVEEETPKLPRRPPSLLRKAPPPLNGIDHPKLMEAPPPPPPRRPPGFSSQPLIPSNPSTPRSTLPLKAEARSSLPATTESRTLLPAIKEPRSMLPNVALDLKPMKPVKPPGLAGVKLDQTPKETPVDVKERPPPPKPRAVATERTMMEWKPLVPQ